MALVFTDAQIKNITKDILTLPLAIDDPINGTGYVQQQQSLVTAKAELLKTDQDQEVFYNFWKQNIDKYYQEYDLLNAQVGTVYPDSALNDGGKERGVHWPTSPIWIPFIPKMISENNGEPFTGTATETEQPKIDDLQPHIDALVNGFSYGAFNDTVDNVTATTFEILYATDIEIADLGILSSGSNATVVRVTGKVPYVPALPGPVPPAAPEEAEVITFEYVAGYVGVHLSTSNFTLTAPPISNAKRGYQVALTPEEDAVLTVLRENLDAVILPWKDHLDLQTAVISTYDDVAPRAQANLDAGTDVALCKSTLEGWEALIVVDPSGKYTDDGLLILTDEMTRRTATSAARAIEIKDTQLGAIAQDGQGNVTGNGIFYELWTTINLRISKGLGSLTKYNSADLGVSFFDKKITDAYTQLDQYTNIFAVTQIVGDTVLGDDEFEVVDESEFSIGQSVKVMDNNSLIYDRTINSISGSFITLDVGIPAVLTESGLGRIVRVK